MPKRVHEIPTIDCCLVTVKFPLDTVPVIHKEYALDTASKIQVDIQTETQDAVKLIIKGVLKAQKHKQVTVTGNQITLTDNVFTPEIVKLLQGGTIITDPETGDITGYVPPVVGSSESLPIFELCAYSAQYNAAGVIVQYEKITYPNCKGNPISMTSEDNVFRVNEYVIDSAPNTGEAPYTIEYVDELPAFIEEFVSVTQYLTGCSSSFTKNTTSFGEPFTATITPDSGKTLESITVIMGETDVSSSVVGENGVITIPIVTGIISITAIATE